MRIVSENYTTQATALQREIGFAIATNEENTDTYLLGDIISVDIERKVAENGLQIGNVISNRASFVLKTSDPIPSGTRLIPKIRFTGGESNTEWLKLGVYYVTASYTEDGLTEITAYDKAYTLDKKCRFTGTGSISALTFPATHQQILDYICTLRGLTCDFVCQPFVCQTKPTGYTFREIIGFIASAHGGNAIFDETGKLQITQYVNQNSEIPLANCFQQQIDTSENFSVNGLRFIVDDETSIYVDDTAGSTYDEDMDGCLSCVNPLASIAIAEYVWNTLGNMTFCACDLSKQGFGWYQPGDVLQIQDFHTLGAAVNIIVMGIQYRLTYDGGFVETISSIAESREQSANRSNQSSLSVSSGGTSKSDVAKRLQTNSTDGYVETENARVLWRDVNYATNSRYTEETLTPGYYYKAAHDSSRYLLVETAGSSSYTKEIESDTGQRARVYVAMSDGSIDYMGESTEIKFDSSELYVHYGQLYRLMLTSNSFEINCGNNTIIEYNNGRLDLTAPNGVYANGTQIG